MARGGRKKESKRIDVPSFKAIVKVRIGSTLSILSQELGFRHDYLSKACHDGALSKFAIQYIKNKYGVPYEDYMYKARREIEVESVETEIVDEIIEPQKLEIVPVSNNITINLTKEELSEIIYQAVYSAMSHAWKDM